MVGCTQEQAEDSEDEFQTTL